MEHERIMVGVDGSDGSWRALRWALGEAARRQADVEIITCWHIPYLATSYGLGALTPEDLSADARRQLDTALTAFEREIELVRSDGLRVEARVIEGPAESTLERESKGADLLVVGRRGHNPISRWLLGSVSRHVAAHATCPVVVVPEP
jgi:nucleotide-binding universal stress UspA family protein